MAFQDTLSLPLEVILPVIAAIAAFAVAAGYTGWVAKQKPGTKEMLDISNAVKEGAAAFLRREMKIIVPIAIGLSVIIGFFIGGSNGVAFAALTAAFTVTFREINPATADNVAPTANAIPFDSPIKNPIITDNPIAIGTIIFISRLRNAAAP